MNFCNQESKNINIFHVQIWYLGTVIRNLLVTFEFLTAVKMSMSDTAFK
jgi:hypothetical protein